MKINSIKNIKIDSLREFIQFKKNYLLSLKKRIALIKTNFAEKSEYEKNEVDIQSYETLIKIDKLNRFIAEKESEYEDNLIRFYLDLEELEKNYEDTLALAKKEQSTNIDLKHILYHVNWKQIEDNIEDKISLYRSIREQLDKKTNG
jgi:hypothetical protein